MTKFAWYFQINDFFLKKIGLVFSQMFIKCLLLIIRDWIKNGYNNDNKNQSVEIFWYEFWSL